MAASAGAVELSRLFSLMEGVDPESLFNAALLRATGGELGAAGLSAQLPPQLQGLEGLGASQLEDGGGLKSGHSGDEGGGSTEDDSKGSVGGAGGSTAVPPRTGAILERRCTKILPASSSAPKYKFVVPNEYVYKFMKHLVERPFHMRDNDGKLWECVLIQRKNKEKYEYMIQGWRRFGETVGVQEGDTVTIEMVSDSVLQLTLEHTGVAPTAKKRRKAAGGAAASHQAASHQAGAPSGGGPASAAYDGTDAAQQRRAQLLAEEVEQREREAGLLAAHGMMQGVGRGQQAGLSMAQQVQKMEYGGGGDMCVGPSGSGGGNPHGLLALLQQQQVHVQQAQQQVAQHQAQQQAQQQQHMAGLMGNGIGGGGGGGGAPLTPRSLSAHLANGLSGPLGQLAGNTINEAQLADLTAVISHLEKRQRVGEGPSGGVSGGGGGANAIQLLSDVADLDKLMQENMGLREELRMMQAKVGTLETGVLNIKSVLTRNTDPGLIAMTGVINLLNQMESPDFLPELGTLGRMTLTGLCSEVRRHLNGVLRMVWILRSLPDDVQQHNTGSAPTNSGGGP